MKKGVIVTCALLSIGVGCSTVQNETGKQNLEQTHSPAFVVEPASASIFDVKKFIPANAENVAVQSMDFEGDGTTEKVVRFKSFDTAKDPKFNRNNYHVQVFAFQNGQWGVVKDDSMPIDNAIATGWYIFVEPIKLHGTSKQALLVEKQNDGTGAVLTYYLFGKENGEFLDYPIKKGYLNNMLVTKEERERSCSAHFYGVATTTLGLEEGYGLFCNGESHRFGTEMRSFSVQHDYNASSGTFTSRVLNN